ncbi:MAG: aldo/keto reductase [Acidobacteriota bacterium]
MSMPKFFQFPGLPSPVMRLGLATRGNTHLKPDDVLLALEHGINYWNWCGHNDGMAAAVRTLGPRRRRVVVATQLEARNADGIRRELDEALRTLHSDYLDVATFYYVESQQEWSQITGPRGAWEGLRRAREEGLVRQLGLTSHQRPLLIEILESGLLDLLMVRYNAAHRGAEERLFELALRLQFPLVTFTALRWKALLKATSEDPSGFSPPSAREWYRWVLAHPAASVVLAAPNTRTELQENLELIGDWRPPDPGQYEAMGLHGDRVRRLAGRFP